MCKRESVSAHDRGLERDTANADGHQRCGGCQLVLAVTRVVMRSQRAGCARRSVASVARLVIWRRSAGNVRKHDGKRKTQKGNGKGKKLNTDTITCCCCGEPGHRTLDCRHRHEN